MTYTDTDIITDNIFITDTDTDTDYTDTDIGYIWTDISVSVSVSAKNIGITDNRSSPTNNTGYNQNHENECDMEEETSLRDEIIVKLRTKSDTLETENKELKEQLEKLTQVMINMNNALKSKQG